MSRLAWLTPDAATGLITCRRLRIPIELLPMVNGALLHLIEEFNWELHGSMTVEEAVELSEIMIDDYFVGGTVCMIGSIHPYATTVLPTGVLACDGSSYLRVDYPELYAALDAVYITDPDNFTVPDLRGRGVVGTGSGVGLTPRSMGDTGGGETHQLVIAEMPTHDHGIHQHDPNLDVEAPGAPDFSAGIPLPLGTTDAEGGDGSHENMPPFESLSWGIVAFEDVPLSEGVASPFTSYPSVHVGDTASKTPIVQHTVAAGSLGADGMADLTVDLMVFNDSGATYTILIEGEFGGTSIGSIGVRIRTSVNLFTLMRVVFTLQNDGADDSQFSGIYVLNAGKWDDIDRPTRAALALEAYGGLLGMATNVASEDTSLDQVLKVSITLSGVDPAFYVDAFSSKVLQP